MCTPTHLHITLHPGTYDYVLEKYEAVPKHISIIFLGMFRDLIDGSDEGSPQVRTTY